MLVVMYEWAYTTLILKHSIVIYHVKAFLNISPKIYIVEGKIFLTTIFEN